MSSIFFVRVRTSVICSIVMTTKNNDRFSHLRPREKIVCITLFILGVSAVTAFYSFLPSIPANENRFFAKLAFSSFCLGVGASLGILCLRTVLENRKRRLADVGEFICISRGNWIETSYGYSQALNFLTLILSLLLCSTGVWLALTAAP